MGTALQAVQMFRFSLYPKGWPESRSWMLLVNRRGRWS